MFSRLKPSVKARSKISSCTSFHFCCCGVKKAPVIARYLQGGELGCLHAKLFRIWDHSMPCVSRIPSTKRSSSGVQRRCSVVSRLRAQSGEYFIRRWTFTPLVVLQRYKPISFQLKPRRRSPRRQADSEGDQARRSTRLAGVSCNILYLRPRAASERGAIARSISAQDLPLSRMFRSVWSSTLDHLRERGTKPSICGLSNFVLCWMLLNCGLARAPASREMSFPSTSI